MGTKRNVRYWCLLAAAALAAPVFAADFPMSYQGHLKFDGLPANGSYDFKFRLVDAAERGRLLQEIVLTRVPVADGLFQAQLAFEVRHFTGAYRWLSVHVRRPNDVVYDELTPAQPISYAPYALFAMTGNEGPQGPPGPQGPAGEGMTLPYAGTVAAQSVAFGVTQTGIAAAGAFQVNNVANTQPALYTATNGTGPVILSMSGGAGPAFWGIAGAGGGAAGYFQVQPGESTQEALFAKNQANGTAGHFWATKRQNTAPALIGETSGDGSAALFKTNSDPNNVNLAATVVAENHAWAPAGTFKIFNAATTANTLEASTVGPGTALKAWTTGTGHAAEFEINNGSNTTQALKVSTNGTGPAGYFVSTANEGSANTLAAENFGDGNAVFGNTWGNGDAIAGNSSFGGDAISGLAAGSGHAGAFQVANPQGTNSAVEATTNGRGPAGNFTNTNASATSAALTAESASARAAVEGENANGNYGRLGERNYGVFGRHESANNEGYIGGLSYGVLGRAANGSYGYLGSEMRGVEGLTRHPDGVGVYGRNFSYDNHGELGTSFYGVTGISNRSGGAGGYFRAYAGGKALIADGTAEVDILQIVGGADVAEPFEVSDDQPPLPGMVVSIDPDHAGKLRIARRAYDRTVAGIVSGAGGVAAGLTLQHRGTQADGSVPVALTGRVWVWCDADANGSIQPGDLLTSSDTAGHAMKVTDFDRAHGAIIGKAMTSLDGGRGLVLVLVSLQ